MDRELKCLRCGAKMENIGNEEIQLGHESFLLGSLSNLLSGSINVDIYKCPECDKLEFFYGEDN